MPPIVIYLLYFGVVTVALPLGLLFIERLHFIRGTAPRVDHRQTQREVRAVAVFDSSVSIAAKVSRRGRCILRVTVPGDYFVGLAGEGPESAVRCRIAGSTDLAADLHPKTCVAPQAPKRPIPKQARRTGLTAARFVAPNFGAQTKGVEIR